MPTGKDMRRRQRQRWRRASVAGRHGQGVGYSLAQRRPRLGYSGRRPVQQTLARDVRTAIFVKTLGAWSRGGRLNRLDQALGPGTDQSTARPKGDMTAGLETQDHAPGCGGYPREAEGQQDRDYPGHPSTHETGRQRGRILFTRSLVQKSQGAAKSSNLADLDHRQARTKGGEDNRRPVCRQGTPPDFMAAPPSLPVKAVRVSSPLNETLTKRVLSPSARWYLTS